MITVGKQKRTSLTQRVVTAYSHSTSDLTFSRSCDSGPECEGLKKPCPFRDAEAAYEAQYYARLKARKNGVLFNDTPSMMGSTALHEEVAKCLKKGPKKKCCHSSPRCMRGPYVFAQLRKADVARLDDENLKRTLKKLRNRA